jgi:hypothetical protein
LLLKPDGRGAISARRTGAVVDAVAIGAALGRELRRRAGAEYGFR